MDWQTLTALIVFACVANLIRIATKGLRGKASSGCHSGCGACLSNKQKLVTIDLKQHIN